jgi:hypothetical protein
LPLFLAPTIALVSCPLSTCIFCRSSSFAALSLLLQLVTPPSPSSHQVALSRPSGSQFCHPRRPVSMSVSLRVYVRSSPPLQLSVSFESLSVPGQLSSSLRPSRHPRQCSSSPEFSSCSFVAGHLNVGCQFRFKSVVRFWSVHHRPFSSL